MAILRKNEIQSMSVDQMKEKLKELRKELMKLNAQRSMGTAPESPGKIKTIKRTISKLIFFIENKNTQEVKEKQ